jgi:hypothetical protein
MSKLSPSKVSDAAKRIANMITDGGATMRTITTALMISTPMAQAALEQLGAVQTKSGRWVIDNEPEQFGNSEALVTSDCVEKQEQVIPVSEINQADTSKGIPVDLSIDWVNAPEGATHYHQGEFIRWTGKKDSYGFFALDAYGQEGWTETAYSWIGTLGSFLANDAIPRPVCTATAPLGGIRSELPQTPPASDFAARQSVEHALVTAALREHRGATASRLSEITGLAVENVADALEELMIGLVVQPYNPLHVLAYQLKDVAK